MKTKALLLLLLLSTDAISRDPFAPPAITPCLQEVPLLTDWRLKGIIGDDVRHIAWLLGPQGALISVDQVRAFPLVEWRVKDIGPRSIMLIAPTSCRPQQIELRLKGK